MKGLLETGRNIFVDIRNYIHLIICSRVKQTLDNPFLGYCFVTTSWKDYATIRHIHENTTYDR